MKSALALLALLSATAAITNLAHAAPDQTLPEVIDKSITEQNVSTAISELKKDAENLRARLKDLEASLPREVRKTKTAAAE